jgi:hypothetical protein
MLEHSSSVTNSVLNLNRTTEYKYLDGSAPPAYDQESPLICVLVIFVQSTFYKPGYFEWYYTVYDEASMRPK